MRVLHWVISSDDKIFEYKWKKKKKNLYFHLLCVAIDMLQNSWSPFLRRKQDAKLCKVFVFLCYVYIGWNIFVKIGPVNYANPTHI